MNFQDIIAPVKDQFLMRWEALQESTAYAELKEKFEGLSPTVQKSIIFGAVALVIMFFLSFPLGWMNSAGDSIASFDDKKQVTTDLLDVVQEIKTSPPAPQRLSSADLKTRIDKMVGDAALLPEQIKNIKEEPVTPSGSRLIPNSIMQNGVRLEIAKLNLKQIVDFEFQLTKISPLVKVLSLDMYANAEDNHYYDIKYKVVAFNVEEAPLAPPGGKNKPFKDKSDEKTNKSSDKNDKDKI